MAAQWSTEPVIAEFKDLPALTMAVDCLGCWTLLAGRRVLAGVELSKLRAPVRVQKQKQWDISRVQWNPHASHASLFVLACNQRLEVHRWMGSSSLTCLNQFSGHSRNISDVDWSPFDVNIIASCSTDAYIHLWDIREPKKPVVSFENHAGASQVKWNRVRSNLLATTHETEVRLWDPRKRNCPLRSVNAHLKQINCLDWCPHVDNKFITASVDNTIKFWDVDSAGNKDEGVIVTSIPVWQARYTPFPQGVTVVLMAKLGHGDGNIYLHSAEPGRSQGSVHTFTGHSDIVLDMQWMKKKEGCRDYHMVSWSRDQTLRIWQVEARIQRLCDHDLDVALDEEEVATKSFVQLSAHSGGSTAIPTGTASAQASSQSDPQSLSQEFSLVNFSIPLIAIEELDAAARLCKVSVESPHHQVQLSLHFPPSYPVTPPEFQLSHCTLEPTSQKRLIKVLTDTSQKNVKRNMNCLEPCLRQLSCFMEGLTQEERRTPDLELPYMMKQQQALQPASLSGLYSFRGFKDDSIPFPRTSGARFSPNGHLIAFGVPPDMKKALGRVETPKAMVELVAYAQPAWKAASRGSTFSSLYSRSPPTPSNEPVTISSFFTSNQQQRTRSKSRNRHRDFQLERPRKRQTVGSVKIYDVTNLLTISKERAVAYSMDTSDLSAMCHHNAAVAEAFGRKDLVQSWRILATLTDKSLHSCSLSSGPQPWAMRPLGRPLINRMMDYYKKIYDVQMLAMICCVFWDKKDAECPSLTTTVTRTPREPTPVHEDRDQVEEGDQYNPYHTVHSLASLSKARNRPRTLLPTTPCHALPGVTSHPNLATIFHPGVKNRRSNSWSDSYNEYQIVDDLDQAQSSAERRELLQHQENCKMLDPAGRLQQEEFKRIYASVLFAWGLLNQAASMRNFLAVPVFTYQSKAFKTFCHQCGEETSGVKCRSCCVPSILCAICRISVRGAANMCLACGHGGHTTHLLKWFQTEVVCPTGCGCHCLDESVLTSSS